VPLRRLLVRVREREHHWFAETWAGVTVEGNGSELRQLIAKRPDIFAAYLQMEPKKRKEQ
jgi:hypothetical protein